MTNRIFGPTVGCEVCLWVELREYDRLVKRLRAVQMKAEEEFRLAADPESKDRTRERYEHTLAQYRDLILRQ